jgi:glycogen synthase
MRVLQVCSELFPLLKTGGLADVCAALPSALAPHGCDVRVLMPGFPAIKAGIADARPLAPAFALPDEAQLLHGALADGTRVYLIDAPMYAHGDESVHRRRRSAARRQPPPASRCSAGSRPSSRKGSMPTGSRP